MVNIEVAAATLEKQKVVPLQVSEGTHVQAAIELSGILTLFAELPPLLDFTNQGFSVGIFSKKVSFETLVKEGDRVEIYFPLKQSAMDARKARAAARKG